MAVIGLPDDDLGNRIHAIVNAKGEVTAEDLSATCGPAGHYKQPRTTSSSTSHMRDDAGKVRRTALRDARIKAQA